MSHLGTVRKLLACEVEKPKENTALLFILIRHSLLENQLQNPPPQQGNITVLSCQQ